MYVAIPVFTSIVCAFVCSRIDYYNSLLINLPKVRLSPIQTMPPFDSLEVRRSRVVLFAATRLRGPRFKPRPGQKF